MNFKLPKVIISIFFGLIVVVAAYAESESINATMDNSMENMDTMKEPADNAMMMPESMNMEMNAEEAATDEEAASDEPAAVQAIAIIEGTKEGSELYGEVEFVETKEGLSVTAEVYNAPKGKHGIHIHENGSCEETGNAAGGHFNPDAVQHGMVSKDGLMKAHVGDMGNIEVDEYGDGYLTTFIPGASLTQGKYNITGKAVILHGNEDDMSQPTGNAGPRIGCGVIETTE